MAREPPRPKAIPMTPPINDSVMASTRNWSRMSRPRAPTAMRRPISRVRSVTDTSMMFMMPMPPTSSETEAIAARRYVMTFDDSSCLEDLGQVAQPEVVVLVRLQAVTLAQQPADLALGLPHIFPGSHLDRDRLDGTRV